MYKQIGEVSNKTVSSLLALSQLLDWKINKGLEVDYKTIQGFEDRLKDIHLPWDQEKIKSARFICIPSGGNIKRHSDNTKPDGWKIYHIPLSTNDHCINLVYKDGETKEFHLPVGTLWEFDAWPEHESFNLGKTDRIHLVINIYE